MKRLETARLVLRGFKHSDANDVFDYAKRDDVGPNAGWKPHKNVNETKKIIAQFISKDDVYAMVYKETNHVIGSLGIHDTTLGSIGDVYELGYVLHPDYHRKGLMTEAVYAALDHFFFDQHHEMIYVGHFYGNTPSESLIHRFGFKWVEDINYQSKDYGKKQSKIYQLSILDYTLLKEDHS